MIVTRESMKKWIIECLQERGGSAWPREVSKYVWDSYEAELKGFRRYVVYVAI